MRVFISYAREQEDVADRIAVGMRGAGDHVFLDKDGLSPGEEYDDRIRRSIASSDLFLFLISPESLEKGTYALSELSTARMRWPNPSGRVLPIEVSPPRDQSAIPPYLAAVGVLRPQGNLVAETLTAVEHYRKLHRRRRLVAVGAIAGLLATAAGLLIGIGVDCEEEDVLAEVSFAEGPEGWPIDSKHLDGSVPKWEMAVVGGKYRWELKFAEDRAVYVPSPYGSVMDFYAAVDVRIVDHKDVVEIVFVFGWDGANDAYLFKLRTDKTFALLWISESQNTSRFLVPWQPIEPILRGDLDLSLSNRMIVQVHDRVIKISLNDTTISEIADQTFKGGRIGLQIEGVKGTSAVVDFDNFELRRIK